LTDSGWELADSGWEDSDIRWDFPRGGGGMSFCQAFPTNRDPHRDARMVKSTHKGNATMDAARAPHPTREGACAPLTVNSTRKDGTTMDAARAPHPTREGACAWSSHSA